MACSQWALSSSTRTTLPTHSTTRTWESLALLENSSVNIAATGHQNRLTRIVDGEQTRLTDTNRIETTGKETRLTDTNRITTQGKEGSPQHPDHW